MKRFRTKVVLALGLVFLQGLPAHAQNWESYGAGLIPKNHEVIGISMVDSDIIWAVGYKAHGGFVGPSHMPIVLKTVNGGETWEVYEVEEASSRISWDIEAFDENTALITSQTLGNGSTRGVLKTIDGGLTWEYKMDDDAGGVYIGFFDDRHGVIVNRHIIATTEDGGDTWEKVYHNNIPNYANDEFTILTSGRNSFQTLENHAWFGTSKGRVFRTSDRGKSWKASRTTHTDSAIIASIAFRDTLSGIALSINPPYSQFSITKDGGKSWQELVSTPDLLLYTLEYVPGTRGVLIATGEDYTTKKYFTAISSNFGKSWEILDHGMEFGAIQFISPEVGWSTWAKTASDSESVLFKWKSNIALSSNLPHPEPEIDLYPIPFTDHLVVENNHSDQLKFRIYNNLGGVVRHGWLDNGESMISLNNLTNGVYIIQIGNNTSFKSRKIVKH